MVKEEDMSTTEISMEVVEQYLDYFLWFNYQNDENDASILRLPIFKQMLFDCCQNPDVEFDEEAIKNAIATAEYIYGNVGYIKLLARNKAQEIRESEFAETTAFKLFKTKKELQLIKKEFNELKRKVERLEKKLK